MDSTAEEHSTSHNVATSGEVVSNGQTDNKSSSDKYKRGMELWETKFSQDARDRRDQVLGDPLIENLRDILKHQLAPAPSSKRDEDSTVSSGDSFCGEIDVYNDQGSFYEGWKIAEVHSETGERVEFYCHPCDYEKCTTSVQAAMEFGLSMEQYSLATMTQSVETERPRDVRCEACSDLHCLQDCPEVGPLELKGRMYQRIIPECPICFGDHWGLDCPKYIQARCIRCTGPHWSIHCPNAYVVQKCGTCRSSAHMELNCSKYIEKKCPFCGKEHRAESCKVVFTQTRCPVCAGPHDKTNCQNYYFFYDYEYLDKSFD